ncbi:IS110 family transposase [Halomonas sp. Bachu 37]|uniref:IS110 family transposase n=1 Tax=Halomonas kashgarensis TaxID=3084920 RepID=UPI00321665CD
MNQISIVGIDLAKYVFQLHAVDGRGHKIFSKLVQRDQLRMVLSQLPPCRVAMEACGSAHYWVREIRALGHETELLPPQAVKPFVLGHKNDARDAAAIAEAAARPATPRVAIKTETQQATQAVHRVRSRLVRDRTAIGNELRGLMGEFGLVVAQGHAMIRQGIIRELLDEQQARLGDELFALLADLLDQWRELDARVTHYDKRLQALAKASEEAQRLMSIPGIGPINATLLFSHLGDPARFPSGRQFSASLGLVPRQYSSGGHSRLKGITKRGNGEVRRQLVHGARAALRQFQRQEHPDRLARWACTLAARVGQRKAIVALANKLARICWSLLVHGQRYQPQGRAA